MTIGVVGGGQLGRMLALAGYPLGLDFVFLDQSAVAPAGQIAPLLCAELTDPASLAELGARSDVVTFDWENVPMASLRALARHCAVRPSIAALAAAQDRASEKRLFERLRIPTTRWRAVGTRAQLERAVREIGLPGVVKTRRMGYDGKGQALVESRADLERAWAQLGAVPLIYEEHIAFDCEVSIIGARGRGGQTVVYPLCLNVHQDGMLRLTRAPYGPTRLAERAAIYLKRVLEHFRYVGVLTLEFFVRSGALVANEMAPRVHNSGHWTIEGAETSQFENHVRAISGLPLGATAPRGACAMVNLIGSLPPRARPLAQPGVHLHEYAKEPRPGRKLGHCTLVAPNAHARDARLRRLLAELALDIRIP
ncbi:MAG TPA: 5-(carboxyamino)imidazole ribonucleotide synthase [Steroidobacteraceae bacterium]|nr:5-(carboxyamino)imidazole ribonucleotide synthase [Steroidobacteraceae bacterium]